MSNNENTPEAVVREFIELWQKQFEKISKEPDLAKSTIEMMQQAQESYLDALNQGLNNMNNLGGGFTNAKPATTASFFRSADSQFDKLNRRIEQLEARINELEQGVQSKGGRAKAKA